MATVRADAEPARAGTLGLPRCPRVPHEARLLALAARTGHDIELRGSEGGFYVFDWNVGDALGEGPTRDLALDSAEENA